MAALAWIVAPLLHSRLEGPSAWPRAILLCLTVGMIWQFVFVMIAVRREQGTLRWSVLKEALWLRAPRSPRTGRRGGRLWWILVPCILLVAAKEALPKIPAPVDRDQGLFLQSVAGQEFFAGNWLWFTVIVTMMIFNTVLGEELLFRGLLLPRMRGAFGRWDWLVNGVLFGIYHLHRRGRSPRTPGHVLHLVARKPLPQRADRDLRPQRPDRHLHRSACSGAPLTPPRIKGLRHVTLTHPPFIDAFGTVHGSTRHFPGDRSASRSSSSPRSVSASPSWPSPRSSAGRPVPAAPRSSWASHCRPWSSPTAKRAVSAVRALLRDCVRLPSSWWWLLLAGFGLPVLTWTTGAALGGAQPLTWGLAAFYVWDLVTGALVINIWEEMAWTGFFQRRAASRWGAVGGALVTSVFFTAIHVPLAFAGADGAREIASNVILLAGVAIGVRLLIARVDPWSGRSLLTVGVLHSSFNASETLLDADHFWVRLAVTIAVGIGVVAFGSRRSAKAEPPRKLTSA